jgi:hypothetical protein
MGDTGLALGYDPDSATLMLLALDVDPEAPSEVLGWRIDRFTTPVTLPEGMSVATVKEDGRAFGTGEWIIPIPVAQDRPSIELTLERDDFEGVVYLAPHAITPEVVYPGQDEVASRRPIDLDAQGRDQEVW